MLTPRRLIFSGLIVAALTLFAMPLTQIDAQRSTRGGSGGSSGSSGGSRVGSSGGASRSAPRSTPAPAPRTASRSVPAPSRSVAPSRSTPAPAPSSSRSAAPSRSSSPAPSSSRSSTPSRSGSTTPSSSSPTGLERDTARSTYRSAPAVPRTPSGVPSIEPERNTRAAPSTSRSNTGISRADNVSRTASREPAPSASRSTSPSASRSNSTATRNASTSTSRGDTRSAVAGPTFTQRSTLTSFQGATGASTFRGDSSRPQTALAGPTPFYGYYGSYYGSGYNNHHHNSGWSIGWNLGGGWSIGFSSGWYGHWGHHHGHHGWGSHAYYGSFAAAFLVGTAWHITAYNGFWGYYSGSSCYWSPYRHWGHNNSFYYNGHYCRVNQPYWHGYSRWYDYRPYGYGYTSLVYEDLYEDGYDDGFDRGYNRGYHDGADDAGGLKDDRRRDSIGKPARPRVPDAANDRAKGNALAEYRHEMNRGGDAFNKGDYSQATKAFKEAAILDPESADARYMLSASAMAEGKFAFSAFALRRGMAIDAQGSNLDLPKMFGGPDAVKAQREMIQRDLEKAPDDADLLLLKGFVALRSGDSRTAAEALDRALQHNPQDAAAKQLHKEAMDSLENS